ncbi:MAG: nuclear transport factor 2 family protein [Massilia sp.]
MDSNQNKQLVMRGYELFQQGDIKGVLARCSDDVEIISTENEHVPFTGSYKGLYEAADYFSTLGGSMDALHFLPKEFVAEGDKVVVTGEARWHVKSTGADFHTPWVHIFTISGDKIARLEQYSDSATAVAAFMMPALSEAELAALRH